MSTDAKQWDIEERLRSDLPRLADAILARQLSGEEPMAVPDEPGRRRAVQIAAVAAVVLLIGAAVVLRDRGDGSTDVDVGVRSPVGGWQALPASPLAAREGAVAVWTGQRMLVWGGRTGDPAIPIAQADGAAFERTTGTWRSISPNSWAHPGGEGVWTGDRLVVLAKSGGASYDPVADTWHDLPRLDGDGFLAPVWTGQELVAISLRSTAADDVALAAASLSAGGDHWQLGGTAAVAGNVFAPASSYRVSWTGTEAVVWDGVDEGWAYDPATDTWRTLPRLDAGVDVSVPVSVDGSLYVVASRSGLSGPSLALARATSDGWVWVGAGVAGTLDPDATVTAAGRLAVVLSADAPPQAVEVTTGEWSSLDPSPVAPGAHRSVVWTGDELLVWGGADSGASQPTAAGWRWAPPG